MSCKVKFLSLSWQLPRVLGSTKVAARIFHDSFTLWFQWLFLVPIKGGRWHIIPQLAVYTPYIPLIYCLLGCYMLPTIFYGNLLSNTSTLATWKATQFHQTHPCPKCPTAPGCVCCEQLRPDSWQSGDELWFHDSRLKSCANKNDGSIHKITRAYVFMKKITRVEKKNKKMGVPKMWVPNNEYATSNTNL